MPIAKSKKRLLTVDPSLTCTGWAFFDCEEGTLLSVGSLKSLKATHSLSHRLVDLQERVKALYEDFWLSPSDIVICEAPTTMKDPKAAIKVEQVRCIFEVLARARGVQVPGRINPRTVHRDILGQSGKQLSREIVKQSAVRAAEFRFASHLQSLGFDAPLSAHQDIADALLLGEVALAKIRSAKQTNNSLSEYFIEKASHLSWRRTAVE